MESALITGASRGFGYTIAESLAKRGWNLVLDARGQDTLIKAATRIDSLGEGRVVALPGDISSPDHQEDLVAAAVGLGDFRLLVNNASSLGPSPMPRLRNYPIDSLKSVFAVNVFAPIELTQKALPHLDSGAQIINISSDAAVEAYEGWGGYGASKAALEQLSNVLATEEDEVRVYWLDPGDMRTEMHQEAFPGEDISDRPLPHTRVPALLDLIDRAPPSGRYTAESLLAGATA